MQAQIIYYLLLEMYGCTTLKLLDNRLRERNILDPYTNLSMNPTDALNIWCGKGVFYHRHVSIERESPRVLFITTRCGCDVFLRREMAINRQGCQHHGCYSVLWFFVMDQLYDQRF